MTDFQSTNYGPIFDQLLAIDRRRSLDRGVPNELARDALEELAVSCAFAPRKAINHDMAQCCIAGVWLLHDFLDESHTISQGIETASGSYWHAIMHRREGDYSNAKYWLRRVGPHPVIEAIGSQTGGAHDPFAFVDACESAIRGRGGNRERCLDVQQAEWEALFDYCYHAAIGGL